MPTEVSNRFFILLYTLDKLQLFCVIRTFYILYMVTLYQNDHRPKLLQKGLPWNETIAIIVNITDGSSVLVDQVGLLLFAIYLVVVTIVLVNILIAMMSHSFEDVQVWKQMDMAPF